MRFRPIAGSWQRCPCGAGLQRRSGTGGDSRCGAGGGYTPGSVGIGDPYVPGEGNGGYQVRRYDLDVRFNPATDVLQGTAIITANATQNLSGMNFDLFGLNVESVVVDGEAATFSRAPRELEIQLAVGYRRWHPVCSRHRVSRKARTAQ